MSANLASFLSILAQDMDPKAEHAHEIDTAALYVGLKTLGYSGPVLLHFQHGTAKAVQLLHPVTWRLI
jgi:hypothetical protein